MVMLSLIVDWSGPFDSMGAAQEAATKYELGEVLYLATGKLVRQRISHIQYVGIAGNLKKRFDDQNHHIVNVTRDCKIWIGEISSHSVAGRKSKSHPVKHSLAVYRAEWLIAYFLKLPLNSSKRKRPPPGSLVVFSRWFHRDFEERYANRPHPEWPDFIEYDHDYDHAQLAWFGSPARRERLSKSEIEALALKA